MNTSLALVILTAYCGTCLGCKTIRFTKTEESELPDCEDCSRGQSRLFFGNKCCTEEATKDDNKKPDLKRRLMNATDCGREGGVAPYLHQKVNTKIVNGVKALENEFPWQVAIMKANDTWRGCSAILLSCDPIIVVSAAHCLTNSIAAEPSDIKLAFGAHNMDYRAASPLDTHEVRLEVEEIIIHPSYAQFTVHIGINVRNNLNVNAHENDIAVIKVKKGSTLPCHPRRIWPACLPNKMFEYGGWNRSIVTGWGRVGDGEDLSPVLKKSRIPIVTDTQCIENILQDNPEFPEDQVSLVSLAETKLCAGDINTGAGVCQGDSGGPLVTQEEGWQNSGWTAVGITSYMPNPQTGALCGGSKYGVFTEVGKYLDWIA